MPWNRCAARCRKLWRDHSLTITLTVLGVSVCAGAWWLEEGKGFDTAIGIGQGILTGGLVFWLSGPLREVKRPED